MHFDWELITGFGRYKTKHFPIPISLIRRFNLNEIVLKCSNWNVRTVSKVLKIHFSMHLSIINKKNTSAPCLDLFNVSTFRNYKGYPLII